jgi:methionine--tRNA ligase beta chain
MEENITTEVSTHISFDDYLKVEIKAGLIKEAIRVPKSKKLIKMAVFFGGVDMRQIVTNIGDQYVPEQLIGILTPFITNLVPATIMGVESKGMIFATTNKDGGTELIRLPETIELGTKIG